ncbi:MAG: fumarylacetoacetate hydrolase family protein [Steroidobacteraceae bacterium]|jgi:fumarylpyruvate hydrolase|nr:fumarylacetoacetate hydrolase family protein [Steroidobacteraceae bacterium]
MTRYVFPPPPLPAVAVAGTDERFPVHRIYCVGKNYADHTREMGGDPRTEPPVFFDKPATALVASGEPLPYPPRTTNLHHEVELVIAIGTGGRDVDPARALDHVHGYAVGNDYTRRDLQAAAKAKGQPWDTAKGFDRSAAIAPIRPVAKHGHVARGRIWLEVNGVLRQQADVADMTWNVGAVIAELSRYFELQPGDLIYTGTPAGVGAVVPGDVVRAGIDGLGVLENAIVAPGAVAGVDAAAGAR